MPHKRAKRSIREQLRNKKGSDLAPAKQSLSNEAIPKSLARVLNASQIREDFKKRKLTTNDALGTNRAEKRRKVDESGLGKSQPKQKANKEEANVAGLTIKPGESIGHFNRRVEDDMRPLVKSAMQTSLAVSRSVRKAEMEAKALKKNQKIKGEPRPDEKEEDREHTSRPASPALAFDKHAGRPKEFATASSSAPRRLNDIAQAPPEFKRLPRGAVQATTRGASGTGSGKREGVLSMAQKMMMEQEREKAILRYREMKANRRGEGGGTDERDRTGEDNA